jgi:hypothetical protein
MHFDTKSYLKSTCNHTAKHALIARECHRYPGNKVTVIAGLMAMHRWASLFFRSGEEDEQC